MESSHRLPSSASPGWLFRLPGRRRIFSPARPNWSATPCSRTEREAAETRVRTEVQEAAERYAAALRQLALHRDRVLPATQDQIRAARAGFESGGSFLALIEAEQNLRDAELREHALLTESWRRRAVLERSLGAEVPKGEAP